MGKTITILLLAIILTSCSKDAVCECELYTYEKSIYYQDKFMYLPPGVMDTVSFTEPETVEPYGNDCNDHNLMLQNEYQKVELPQLVRVYYYRKIVKCDYNK